VKRGGKEHLEVSPREYDFESLSPFAKEDKEERKFEASFEVENEDSNEEMEDNGEQNYGMQEKNVMNKRGSAPNVSMSPDYMKRGDMDFTFVERRSSLGSLFDRKKVDVTVPEAHCEEGTPDQRTKFAKTYRKACKGNKSCQCDLGVLYYYGSCGVVQSTKDALYWLKLSALRDYIPAQVNLGVICIMMEDFTEALFWFERAAKNGSEWGYYHLGVMYLKGENPEKVVDNVKAFRYFKLATKKGHNMSACNVGTMYLQGLGVQMNYKKAHKWLRKLSTNCCYADYNLGLMYEEAMGVSRSLSKADEHFNLAQNDYFGSSLCPEVTADEFVKKVPMMILAHNF